MMELAEEQEEALAQAEQPAFVVDPRTQEEFALARTNRFGAVQGWVASLKRPWDDPGDDELIRKYARAEGPGRIRRVVFHGVQVVSKLDGPGRRLLIELYSVP